MSIEDLIEKVKEAASKRTPEERSELLRKAHILDENGEFCKEYFPSEYIKIDMVLHPNEFKGD